MFEQVRFKGKAKPLDATDYGMMGRMLQVSEDEIRAVVEVEASGRGFDPHGRIKMLFEPHRFYIELGEGAKLARAVANGLAYRRWGTKSYPADSYPVLERAMAIDKVAALKSASWGLGQIMGFNHKEAGFKTVTEMVNAFADDEEEHLKAMVRFIQANNLDDDLRRHDWSGFARGYNGPGYAKHGYHTKLANAYRKWSQRPDAR